MTITESDGYVSITPEPAGSSGTIASKTMRGKVSDNPSVLAVLRNSAQCRDTLYDSNQRCGPNNARGIMQSPERSAMYLQPVNVVRHFREIDPAIVVKPSIEAKAASRVFWMNSLTRQSKVHLRTMIGWDADAVYMIRNAIPSVDWPDEWLSWRDNQPVIQLVCAPSPASAGLLARHIPAWLDIELARQVLHLPKKGLTRNDIPTGAVGRYTVGEFLAANQRDALCLTTMHAFALNEIELVPNLALRYNSKQSRFGATPVSLWSDEAIVLGRECWRVDGEITLSRDVASLLAIALRLGVQPHG